VSKEANKRNSIPQKTNQDSFYHLDNMMMMMMMMKIIIIIIPVAPRLRIHLHEIVLN
jgi:hypothetical protein